MITLSESLPIQIIDVDSNAALASKYNIRNIPAVVIVNGETEASRLIGNNITPESVISEFNK
jgi:thioredoxin-like negative regulator of GroEL